MNELIKMLQDNLRETGDQMLLFRQKAKEQQAEIDELKSELSKWAGASANEYGQTVQRLTKAQAEIDEAVDIFKRILLMYDINELEDDVADFLKKHRGE